MTDKRLKITIDNGESVKTIEAQAVAMTTITDNGDRYSGNNVIMGCMSTCDLMHLINCVKYILVKDLKANLEEANQKQAEKKAAEDGKVSLRQLLEALLEEL